MMTFSRFYCFLRTLRNVSNESCREIENTHFVVSGFFFSFENRSVFEILSKNMAEMERKQTIWSLRVAYWISKSTRAQAPTPTHARTHREKYVKFIAFHGIKEMHAISRL
jgi:hypothetical protein